MRKSIKINFAYNIFYQLISILIPIFTVPYLSRVLSAEGVGIYSYTSSVVYNLILFATLGMSNLGNRSIAECGGDRKKRSVVFSNLYSIQFFMFVIVTFVYILFIRTSDTVFKSIYYIQLLYLFSGMLDISWLFFGLEEFKITVIRNMTIKVICTICVFIFVKQKDDLSIYVLIMSISNFASQAYLWLYTHRFVDLQGPRLDVIRTYIKPLLVLFIPVLSYSIYKVMDKVMLGYLTSMESVGYYENALKIINIPIGVITALGTVMLPRVSTLVSEGQTEKVGWYNRLSLNVVTLISSGICFGIIAISDNLSVTYFGSEFYECGALLRILGVTNIFIAWASVIRTQYLIPYKEDKIYVISTIGGAIINLIVNLLLIPILNHNGAAIGTVVAEFSVMLLQLIFIGRKAKFVLYIRHALGYIGCGVIMLVLLNLLFDKATFGWKSLVVEIISGVLVFCTTSFIFLVITKDDLYFYLKAFINKKFVKK